MLSELQKANRHLARSARKLAQDLEQLEEMEQLLENQKHKVAAAELIEKSEQWIIERQEQIDAGMADIRECLLDRDEASAELTSQ